MKRKGKWRSSGIVRVAGCVGVYMLGYQIARRVCQWGLVVFFFFFALRSTRGLDEKSVGLYFVYFRDHCAYGFNYIRTIRSAWVFFSLFFLSCFPSYTSTSLVPVHIYCERLVI